MRKPAKQKCPQCGSVRPTESKTARAPKQPSKATAIAELWRVTEKAGTTQISRDYFRSNSGIGDGWTLHWPTFKAFLKAFDDAVSEENELYYGALVELVAGPAPEKGKKL